jgi:hypothetical protein
MQYVAPDDQYARAPTHTERLLERVRSFVAARAAPTDRAELADDLRRLLLLTRHRLSEELDAADFHALVPFPAAAAVGYLEAELWQRRIAGADTLAWRLHVRLRQGVRPPQRRGPYLEAWTNSQSTAGALLQYVVLPDQVDVLPELPGLRGGASRLALQLSRALGDWARGDAPTTNQSLGPVPGAWARQLYRWLYARLPHHLVVLIEQGNADPDAVLQAALVRDGAVADEDMADMGEKVRYAPPDTPSGPRIRVAAVRLSRALRVDEREVPAEEDLDESDDAVTFPAARDTVKLSDWLRD